MLLVANIRSNIVSSSRQLKAPPSCCCCVFTCCKCSTQDRSRSWKRKDLCARDYLQLEEQPWCLLGWSCEICCFDLHRTHTLAHEQRTNKWHIYIYVRVYISRRPNRRDVDRASTYLTTLDSASHHSKLWASDSAHIERRGDRRADLRVTNHDCCYVVVIVCTVGWCKQSGNSPSQSCCSSVCLGCSLVDNDADGVFWAAL